MHADVRTRALPAGVRAIAYDTEILRAVPDKKTPRIDGIEYAGGWQDFAGMGVSCICAIDLAVGLPRVFLEDNLREFAAWSRDSLLVSFNGVSFDDKLLASHDLYSAAGSYDILRELRLACGEAADYTPGLTRGGRTLRDCVRANLDGVETIGDGKDAPILAQQHRYGALVDYCLTDTMLVRRLFLRRAAFIDPVFKVPVRLAEPTLPAPVKPGLIADALDASLPSWTLHPRIGMPLRELTADELVELCAEYSDGANARHRSLTDAITRELARRGNAA